MIESHDVTPEPRRWIRPKAIMVTFSEDHEVRFEWPASPDDEQDGNDP